MFFTEMECSHSTRVIQFWEILEGMHWVLVSVMEEERSVIQDWSLPSGISQCSCQDCYVNKQHGKNKKCKTVTLVLWSNLNGYALLWNQHKKLHHSFNIKEYSWAKIWEIKYVTQSYRNGYMIHFPRLTYSDKYFIKVATFESYAILLWLEYY